jgi:hypothetical protein
VQLPTSIHLVASAETDAKLSRKAVDHPTLPRSLDRIRAELNARQDGVPVAFTAARQSGERSLLVHGQTWVMRLHPTKVFQGRRRGYVVYSVNALRLYDHHRLAEGYLPVRPLSWERVTTLRELGAHADAQYDTLLAAWDGLAKGRLTSRSVTTRLPPRHDAFLDMVSRVIDANERITTAAIDAERPYRYRDVRPVGEQRRGTHSMYDFIVDGRPPDEDKFVQIRGESEQRGLVTRVTGRTVTVRFDRAVDWTQLAKVGELELTPSTVVFRAQRDAVARLREGRSRNPRLLDVLVDHRTSEMTPVPDAPTFPLDDSQLRAFRTALGVPDLMVVVGPPGTGKTEVISQIANATAVGGPGRPPQRVLITSHTNRAVDNVLEKLPGNLVVVRVGTVGSVTAEGEPYLLETLATQLRIQILGTVGAAISGLGDLDVATRWAAELGDRTVVLGAAIGTLTQARHHLAAARRAEGGPVQVELDRLVSAQHKRAARLPKAIASLRQTAGRSGVFASWRHDRTQAKAQRLRLEQESAAVAVADAQRRLDELTQHTPAVLQAGAAVAAAEEDLGTRSASALVAAHSVRAAVGNQVPPPQVRDNGIPEETHADLTTLLAWLSHWLPVLGRRAALLTEWHDEVSNATTQLHPELIRYADVIAATSIGTASRPELSAVDFDLAIVDEAGQIGSADVLVPLVRARRAVLVGDHQQLPPFLDSEVEVWGKGIDDPAVRELLSHSALELLVDGLPHSNVQMLAQQRRMPRVIAEFISQHFYRGMLGTAVERDHTDQLFTGAFAFVDTARLPEGERSERPAGVEDRGQRGFVNPCEARLLVKLAAHYDRLNRDWAVIVPYRAQIKAVTKALIDEIGQPDKVRLNVGSVDAFQGGQRAVVLYGFTRSNPDGHVGFLKELRRTNVAFTRVKEQLVLVGDLATLTMAKDAKFRELSCRLRDYVARWGDIRQYEEIDAKL